LQLEAMLAHSTVFICIIIILLLLQVLPYLNFVGQDAGLRDMLHGVISRQVRACACGW
jgi:hypothetical protein